MKKIILLFFIFSFSFFTLSAQSWLWAKQGKNASRLTYLTGESSMATDNFHNVYETGKYDGDTVIFGSDTLFGTPYSVYLVKYDKNGNLLWAKSSENSRHGLGYAEYVTTDLRDNAYITGDFQDTIYFQSFSLTSPSNYYNNAFLVKYDANGNVKWARQSNTSRKTNVNLGYSIAIDKSERNIYMTGGYEDTVFFGADTLKGTVYPSVFLVKYDSNGNVIWAKQGINGIGGYSLGYSVITDDIGYVYITGFYLDSIKFGAQTLMCPSIYQNNLFIVKYDSSGNVIWAKQPTLPKGSSSSSPSSSGDALGKDNSGNIYVAGYFVDTVSFGPYTLTNSLFQYNSSSSLFWAKYDNNGNLVYAKQAYNPDSLQWEAWSITTDDEKNLYLEGSQDNFGTPRAKIIFGTDTLQSRVKDGCVWLKFDSNGNVLNSYIFPTGGASPRSQVVTDSSGCYVYFGGTTLDTTIIFGNDTVGTSFSTFRPFVARWSDGECTTGINSIESQNLNINLYPNPNNGVFNLVCHFSPSSNEEKILPIIEIYDILGERVLTETLHYASQDDNIINISTEPSGIYLYRVVSQNGNLLSSGKFIIQ